MTPTMAKNTKPAPKLNVQHNYISLKLPVGTFTTSFSGAKVSGQLCKMKGAFQALDGYVQNARKAKTVGEAMNDLLDPKLLDKLVPGWNNPIIPDTFGSDDLVSFTSDLFIKKYPSKYSVVNAKGKYVYLSVPKNGNFETIGFDALELKKV